MSEPDLSQDVRPVVRLADSGSRGVWIFAAVLAVGAVALFVTLDSRRRELNAPATAIAPQGNPPIAAPPPLVIPGTPPETYSDAYDRGLRIYRPASVIPGYPPAVRPPVVAPAAVSRAASAPAASIPPTAYSPPLSPWADAAPRPSIPPIASEATPDREATGASRVRATRLASPSTTVPQGTVIPAVLETALDSTRAGAVRAIVSRDVRGFDGTQVLVPRGSRLYGEYTADLQAGQNRALVQWKKLTRPDGVQIALDSPASDPLGRAGVKGKVDSHFLERFGGAILQSVLDAGVAIASRKASDGTVVVGLPGSTQTITSTLAPKNEVQRTLRVRQGSSVSVFVARDLDFTSVAP